MRSFCLIFSVLSVLIIPAVAIAEDQPDTVERPRETVISFPSIDRCPPPSGWRRPRMNALPTFHAKRARGGSWQVDLRQADVSELDLRDRRKDLLYASFDDGTRWPEAALLPAGFDEDRLRILEYGKDPGLGVRDLHQQGITGKGVGIAIIDQTLLTEHVEYRERLRLYEEMPPPKNAGLLRRWFTRGGQGVSEQAAMHGAAVASIAVGRTVGVAPGADLYYIAADLTPGGGQIDYVNYAAAIERILEINAQLPHDQRIRVISIQKGWHPSELNHDAISAAAGKAADAGLLVICSSVDKVHGVRFHGLGRQPLADPQKADSFEPGLWWLRQVDDQGAAAFRDRLLVPMDSRTTASPHSPTEYVFYRQGGWSWSIPYIAGLYALAAQVHPEVTPGRFWAAALATGDTVQIRTSSGRVEFGPIVNPQRLIDELVAKRGTGDTRPAERG